MQIDVHAKEKTVCVWLGHKEQESQAVKKELEALYAAYGQRKYRVAVYYSGWEDISVLTLGILQYNKKKLEQDTMEMEASLL